MTSGSPIPEHRRKLATIERISSIRDIPGADAIVCATIRGWDVVVKRGEFVEGDLCLYLEVDTLVDVTDARFEFLASRGVRVDAEGVRGHVLKTARLRGQYSQGLALPLSLFPELAETGTPPIAGTDVSHRLPVKRWDPPIPPQLSGAVRGAFPRWIRKTDEERLQNVADLLGHRDVQWVATEKLDGTSTTIYVDPEKSGEERWGVCSRNYDLAHTAEQTQWRLATANRIHELSEAEWPGERVALQGEAVGEGIQGNPLKLKGHHLALFTVTVSGRDLPREEWPHWAIQLAVPELYLPLPSDVASAIDTVDGLESRYAPGRKAEGAVWRAQGVDTLPLSEGFPVRASFKVISRAYLLKNDR